MYTQHLILLVSWGTFRSICNKFFPYVRKSRRKTDYCDHCALYQQQVLPKFWRDIADARQQLEVIRPDYFADLDQYKPAQKAEVDDPAKYCTYIVRHMNRYIDTHRESLSLDEVSQLHKTAVPLSNVCRWHEKVLSAYTWHVRYPTGFYSHFTGKP